MIDEGKPRIFTKVLSHSMISFVAIRGASWQTDEHRRPRAKRTSHEFTRVFTKVLSHLMISFLAIRGSSWQNLFGLASSAR